MKLYLFLFCFVFLLPALDFFGGCFLVFLLVVFVVVVVVVALQLAQ